MSKLILTWWTDNRPHILECDDVVLFPDGTVEAHRNGGTILRFSDGDWTGKLVVGVRV